MAPRSRSPAAEYVILKRFATRDALEHKSISEHGGKSITILYKCRFSEVGCQVMLRTRSQGHFHVFEVLKDVPHRLEVHAEHEVTKARLIALGKCCKLPASEVPRRRNRSPSPSACYNVLQKFSNRQKLDGFVSAIIGPASNCEYNELKKKVYDGGAKIEATFECKYGCYSRVRTFSEKDTHWVAVNEFPHNMERHNNAGVSKERLIALGKECRSKAERGVEVPNTTSRIK
uniref:Uncharacterized protein n=2 Tax=Meloidogyne TaxID=189290 RepID=A0A6V7VH56_MELEN|nr:unnamed protein product [Meloidogyne enterolobii]